MNEKKIETSNFPFDLPTHEEFVKYVDEFLEEYNIKPTVFGRNFLKDSAAILRLKKMILNYPRSRKYVMELRK